MKKIYVILRIWDRNAQTCTRNGLVIDSFSNVNVFDWPLAFRPFRSILHQFHHGANSLIGVKMVYVWLFFLAHFVGVQISSAHCWILSQFKWNAHASANKSTFFEYFDKQTIFRMYLYLNCDSQLKNVQMHDKRKVWFYDSIKRPHPS